MYSLRYNTSLAIFLSLSILLYTKNLSATATKQCDDDKNLFKALTHSGYLKHKQRLKLWKISWQNTEMGIYINFYSQTFNNGSKNFTQWKKHKQRIFNKNKGKITLKLSDIKIYQSIENPNITKLVFFQNYHSPGYSSKSYKEQHWLLEEDTVWRIIYENTLNYNSCNKSLKNQLTSSVVIIKKQQQLTDHFFTKNNLSYSGWIKKAIQYETSNQSQYFDKAITIYQQLIKTTQADQRLIARLRLARLYLQNDKISMHYQKAIRQFKILEKTAKVEYLIFTHYINAIIYSQGYSVKKDINKARDYLAKYKKILEKNIKVSVFLQDISLTPANKLKQIIDASSQLKLNWKNKNIIPKFWENKPFCQRETFNKFCHNPSWSVKDCQKVFFNDRINNNLCNNFKCNQTTQPCFEITQAENKKTLPLYQQPSANSPQSGQLNVNARYLLVDQKQLIWDQSLAQFKKADWVEVMWCESGPVFFLNQCQGDIQMGYIMTQYLKLIKVPIDVIWVRK